MSGGEGAENASGLPFTTLFDMAYHGPVLRRRRQVEAVRSLRITGAEVDGESGQLHIVDPDGRARTIPAEFRDGGWRIDLQALER